MKKGFEKIGYKWRSKNATEWGDANEIGKALEKIKERTPENILKASKDDPALNKIFYSKDDSEYAYKWRLHEARQLCANLVTVYQEIKTQEIIEVKTFESIPIIPVEKSDEDEEKTTRMYVNVVENLDNTIIRGQIINEIIKLQKAATEKLESLNDVIDRFQ